MLPLPMLQLLEPVLNKVLALDPATASRLPSLAGRPLRVVLLSSSAAAMNLTLTLKVENDQLRFASAEDAAAITLSGSLQDFAQAALNRGELAAGTLQVQGDVGAAQRWQTFFADLQPDWEEELSKYLGDIIGPQLAAILRSLSSWLKAALIQLQETGVEYLQEEARLLVAPAELQAFMTDVDRLRDDAERLLQKARLQNLARPGVKL